MEKLLLADYFGLEKIIRFETEITRPTPNLPVPDRKTVLSLAEYPTYAGQGSFSFGLEPLRVGDEPVLFRVGYVIFTDYLNEYVDIVTLVTSPALPVGQGHTMARKLNQVLQ
jgi:hypothetical protein